MSLADNLARLRLVDGHSVQEVAEATRLPISVITAIETGLKLDVPPRIVRALARHFRVTPAELME